MESESEGELGCPSILNLKSSFCSGFLPFSLSHYLTVGIITEAANRRASICYNAAFNMDFHFYCLIKHTIPVCRRRVHENFRPKHPTVKRHLPPPAFNEGAGTKLLLRARGTENAVYQRNKHRHADPLVPERRNNEPR